MAAYRPRVPSGLVSAGYPLAATSMPQRQGPEAAIDSSRYGFFTEHTESAGSWQRGAPRGCFPPNALGRTSRCAVAPIATVCSYPDRATMSEPAGGGDGARLAQSI